MTMFIKILPLFLVGALVTLMPSRVETASPVRWNAQLDTAEVGAAGAAVDAESEEEQFPDFGFDHVGQDSK